jgi:signal transduction histidine kinase
VTISCPGVVTRFIRVTATKLWWRGDYHAFALAELQAWSGHTNVALGKAVNALDSVEYGFWSTNALVDGFASQQRLVDLSSWLRHLGQVSKVEAALRSLEIKQTQLTREVLAIAGRWSLGLLAALLLAAAALAYRYRLLRALELERLRTRIATDLHDELGTRLTRIGLVTELAERETGSSHPARTHLVEISGMTRELVRTMDEIVWAVNPRNDTLDDLANYVFHFAQEFFRDTPVRCRLDVPTDLPPLRLTPELRHNLFLAVKEAANNLLKHAQAQNALVRFQFDQSRGLLTLEVTDDGAGFDPSATGSQGNGLRNMRQRMESIGGRMDCQSERGKGTRVLFQVQLKT